MDAKTIRSLVLLAVLSLFCATVAWAVDHAVFSGVFGALAVGAAIGARPWARSSVTMAEEKKEMVVLLVVAVIMLLAPLAFGAGLLMMR